MLETYSIRGKQLLLTVSEHLPQFGMTSGVEAPPGDPKVTFRLKFMLRADLFSLFIERPERDNFVQPKLYEGKLESSAETLKKLLPGSGIPGEDRELIEKAVSEFVREHNNDRRRLG